MKRILVNSLETVHSSNTISLYRHQYTNTPMKGYNAMQGYRLIVPREAWRPSQRCRWYHPDILNHCYFVIDLLIFVCSNLVYRYSSNFRMVLQRYLRIEDMFQAVCLVSKYEGTFVDMTSKKHKESHRNYRISLSIPKKTSIHYQFQPS